MGQKIVMPRPYHHSFMSRGKKGEAISSTPSLASGRSKKIVWEGLMSVTGHHIEAIILQKLLYWTGRLWDFDQFMHEERARGRQESLDRSPESGWVAMTVENLGEELTLRLSKRSIRGYLKTLVRKEYLYEREDPVYPWEHALQYRVNLVKLRKVLARRGYPFDGRIFD